MTRKIIHFKGNATGYLSYIGFGLYLRQHYNLRHVKFSGCSSGAIISAIMALNIDLAKAAILLFQAQPKSTKQFAMVGNWKKRLKLYFENVLPNQYEYEKIDSLRVGVQFLNGFKFIEKFQSKSDLTNCLLASTHIPFIMNFKPFDKFRGRICVDGDLLRNYERKKEKEGFFLHYDLSFIKSISKKNEDDFLKFIEEGYRSAAANTDLNTYLEEYRTNNYQYKPVLDLLEEVQNYFESNHKKELEYCS